MIKSEEFMQELMPDLLGHMKRYNRYVSRTIEIASYGKGHKTHNSPDYIPTPLEDDFLFKLNYQDRFDTTEDFAIALTNIYENTKDVYKIMEFLVGMSDNKDYTPIYVIHEKKLKKEDIDLIEEQLGVTVEEVSNNIKILKPV